MIIFVILLIAPFWSAGFVPWSLPRTREEEVQKRFAFSVMVVFVHKKVERDNAVDNQKRWVQKWFRVTFMMIIYDNHSVDYQVLDATTLARIQGGPGDAGSGHNWVIIRSWLGLSMALSRCCHQNYLFNHIFHNRHHPRCHQNHQLILKRYSKALYIDKYLSSMIWMLWCVFIYYTI